MPLPEESTSFISADNSQFGDTIEAYMEKQIDDLYDIYFSISGDTPVLVVEDIDIFHPLILEEMSDGSFKISFYYFPGGGDPIDTREWVSESGEALTWSEVI